MIIQSAIKTQNSENTEIFEQYDFKIRPIVSGSECRITNLNHWIDILLKPFLKHIKALLAIV